MLVVFLVGIETIPVARLTGRLPMHVGAVRRRKQRWWQA